MAFLAVFDESKSLNIIKACPFKAKVFFALISKISPY